MTEEPLYEVQYNPSLLEQREGILRQIREVIDTLEKADADTYRGLAFIAIRQDGSLDTMGYGDESEVMSALTQLIGIVVDGPE